MPGYHLITNQTRRLGRRVLVLCDEKGPGCECNRHRRDRTPCDGCVLAGPREQDPRQTNEFVNRADKVLKGRNNQ